MIQLTRTRTAESIPAALQGEKRQEKEIELLTMYRDHLRDNGTGSPAWKTSYWKSGKEILKKESAGKCAYCESPTDVVAHGDVEHFRPKSVYWWLVYCFDNHSYSCQLCNQAPYKLDKFPLGHTAMAVPDVRKNTSDTTLEGFVDAIAPDPLDVGAGYTLSQFERDCLQEKPGFPNPYQENPETYFKWRADEVNKEVWIEARTNSARNRFVLESCDRDLGLNREELRRWRWTLAYEELRDFKLILEDLQTQGITGRARGITENAIRRMMEPDRPYAGMVRYFVNNEWNLGL